MADLQSNKAVVRKFFEYLFVVRDGKIESFKEYFDTMHAHEVLCSAPAPGFNS